jgi:hypothetical protein
MIVTINTYTARAVGARIKPVRCARCQQDYFYEVVRTASGSGATVYGIGAKSAQQSAANEAHGRLPYELYYAVDPVPCPKCGTLQPDVEDKFRKAKRLPIPGMPPALVAEQPAPAMGTAIPVRLKTATPQKVEVENGQIIVQEHRMYFPAACCMCGVPAEQPFKMPRSKPYENGLRACPKCLEDLGRRYSRRRLEGALLGLCIGGLVGFLFSLVPEADGGAWVAGGVLGVIAGAILAMILPDRLEPKYRTVIDRSRGIVQYRFASQAYMKELAEAATECLNAGPVLQHLYV